jgi:hypothetical protein
MHGPQPNNNNLFLFLCFYFTLLTTKFIQVAMVLFHSLSKRKSHSDSVSFIYIITWRAKLYNTNKLKLVIQYTRTN